MFVLWLVALACGNCEKSVASESGGLTDDFDATAGASSSVDDLGGSPASTAPTEDQPTVSSAPNKPASDDDPPADGEVWPAPTPRARFLWTNADADSATTIDGHTLTGTVENLTDDVLFLELRVQADAGTNHVLALPPAALELPGGTALDVEVPLDAFGFDFAAQLYSGSVSLRLFAFDAEGSAQYEVEYGPTLYFHPDGGGLMVYGDQLLRTTYNAGDYSGLKDIEPEPDTVITRIVQGTHVTYADKIRTEADLIAEGDDAAPLTVEEVTP